MTPRLVLVLLLLVPPSAMSESRPTQKEIEAEIFENMTFPSVVLGVLLTMKKTPVDDASLSLDQRAGVRFAFLGTYTGMTWKKRHAAMKGAMVAGIDLRGKTRHQREWSCINSPWRRF